MKCYDQCLGVCEKPLLNAWTQAMMLENGILPRKHACLKLHDDPGNIRPRHSPLCEYTLIAQIEGRTMHLQIFILFLVVLVESNHRKKVLRLAMVKIHQQTVPRELGVSLARSSYRARAPAASDYYVGIKAMLWIDDDNGILRYTRCSAFQKCVIKVRRSAPNAVLLTRMTLNVTFKTACWPIMSHILLPLNLSPRRNHIKWYYMIWLCFRPFLTFVWPLSCDFDLGSAQNYHIPPRHPWIP